MKNIIILSILINLVSCSSALLTANSNRLTTQEKIAQISKMDKKEINYVWSDNRNGCSTAIDCAIKKHDYELVEYLLKRGADSNIAHRKGIFPIQRIVLDNSLQQDMRLKLLKLIISNGALVNICDGSHDSIINYLINKNDYDGVKLLLDNGASVKRDIGCRNKSLNPTTPLENAIKNGKSDKIGYEIIKLLISYKADVMDIENEYTPYYSASFLAEVNRKYDKKKVIDDYASKLTDRYPNYYETVKEQYRKWSEVVDGYTAKREERNRRFEEDAKKQKLEQQRESQPIHFIDDSNKWSGALQNAFKTISLNGTKKNTIPKTYPSTNKPNVPDKKHEWFRCTNSNICDRKMVGRKAIHQYTNIIIEEYGNTPEEACQKTRHGLPSFAKWCNKIKKGIPVGAQFSACGCGPSLHKCKISVNVYCE